MSSDDEGLVQRWSRRKHQARTQEKDKETEILETVEPLAVGTLPVEVAADGTEAEDNAEDSAESEIPDLPDIDDLDGDSDFSPFMQVGVPESLQRLALRKLWQTNPLFAELDGLNDYDDDFKAIYEAGVEFMAKAREAGEKFIGEPTDDEEEAEEIVSDEENPAEEVSSEVTVVEEADTPVQEDEDEDLGTGEA